MFGSADLVRETGLEANGDDPLEESRGGTDDLSTEAGATARLLSSETVVRPPILRAASGLRELSRASSGLRSPLDPTSTPRNTRSISGDCRASDGARVVNGPVMTMPVWSPSVGSTRSAGLARRVRFGLVKSSCATTVQPLRSTEARRTRPLRSSAG